MFGLVWAMLLANLVFWVGFLAWDGFLQFLFCVLGLVSTCPGVKFGPLGSFGFVASRFGCFELEFVFELV